MATSRQLHRLKTSKHIFTFFLITCLLLLALPAVAQDTTPPSTGGVERQPGKDTAARPAATEPQANAPSFWQQQHLLGDWGGERTKLAEQYGVSFDFFYVSDMLGVPEARIKTGSGAWNRVRGSMDIDFGKLTGTKGLTFHVTGLWQGGPNIGANYLGSISNPSGLVSARTEMLDSYWLAYAMAGGKVTIRAGQFASMDYYGLQPYGGGFLMEPLDYGFNNRFNDYASFDPASGPGVQLIANPYPFMYFSVAYTSGNRNPYVQDPNGFHFVKHNSGVVSDAIGFKIDQPGTGKATKTKYLPGQYELGSTYNGGKFANPFCSSTTQVTGCPLVSSPYYSNPLYYSPYTSNYLFYFMANQAVYRTKGSTSRGLDVLFGIATTPNAPYNFVDKNLTTGFIFNGPITSRPKDTVSFALSYSHVSDVYASYYLATSPAGAWPYSSEKAYEVNYAFQATPFWLIQPVVQWYQDVGGFSKAGTGVALGFRTKVDF